MKPKRLRPARDLRRAVQFYGGVNGAAKQCGIEYASLARFMSGKGGITDKTMLAILYGLGLTQEQAFVRK